MRLKNLSLALCAISSFTLSSWVLADAQLVSGDIVLGVNDEAHLNVADIMGVTINTGSTGLTYIPVGDATSPGCLCEGWGVSVENGGTHVGYASVDSGGISNLTVDSFVSDPTTATSVVHLTDMPGVMVTHEFMPFEGAPENAFRVAVTIANTTGMDLMDTRYMRAMDWDVPPTEFSEFVTILGSDAANVLSTSDNGFAVPDPTLIPLTDIGPCGVDTDFVKCGPDDHGAGFVFGFGDLADGETVTFDIFYGAGEDEAEAIFVLGEIGAEVVSLGYSSIFDDILGESVPNVDSPVFFFAFSEVGGDIIFPDPTPDPIPTPEPGSLGVLALGCLGLGLFRRRRN
ncbi:PEP-CTERM sorting domain-containing protein [Zooshikella marina]|uniref:PEP-CTERM sorting domain-containing protein n=1 Tax=Zooshikella ganghwensis TaxID=202772 RepID=UPI001BB0B70E|nr:PEP-CTERM sorting domain-containing protein [Zooshikella ganghwensis]MBU2708049.1 PEP-CTERM sorting domain-containing protein [Zooshikella ganghwensis]